MADYAASIPRHPTLVSDVPFGGASNTGVLSVAKEVSPLDQTHYFIRDIAILQEFHKTCIEDGFILSYWTPWQADCAAWIRLRPEAPIKQEIFVVPSPSATETKSPSLPPSSATTFKSPKPAQKTSSTTGAPSAASTTGAPPPAPPPQQQGGGNSIPSPMDFMSLINTMMTNQQNMQQNMMATQQTFMANLVTQINNNQSTTAPTPAPAPAPAPSHAILPPPFPTYDGLETNKAKFLVRVAAFKEHDYFTGVRWDKKQPSSESQSKHLRSELLREGVLPDTELSPLLHVVEFVSDGFKMLQAFLDNITPTSNSSKLNVINEIINLELGPGRDGRSTFMAKLRSTSESMGKMTLDEILLILCISKLDPDRYQGIISNYLADDPRVCKADLRSLEKQMADEDTKREGLPLLPSNAPLPGPPQPAIQRVQQVKPDPQDTAKSPPYPPNKSPKWKLLKSAINNPNMCPVCFYNNEDATEPRLVFHRTRGCPAMATGGYICKPAPTEAKTLVDEWYKKFPSNLNKGPTPKKADAPSGRRASPAPPAPAPPPSPAPEVEVQPAPPEPVEDVVPPTNKPAPPPPKRNHYQDLEDSSSDEDEPVFDDTYAGAVSGSNNGNASSSDYLPSSIPSRFHLPFGGPSLSKFRSKRLRKRSNRLAAVAARRASASFLSSRFSSIASTALAQKSSDVAHIIPGDKEACGDTGATDDMLEDYSAFTSYTRVYSKKALLGDDREVPIEGIGTAVYKLNGKVIKTRHALHVPSLRAPLISLRRHRFRPGCGVFSAYQVGSFVLYPDFVLEIDDSEDNLVSYQSLGPAYTGPIDYCEPRHALQPNDYVLPQVSGRATKPTTPSNKQAPHVIPDDDNTVSTANSSSSDSSVTSTGDDSVPLPPQSSPSTTPPTATDSELAANSKTPLPPSTFKTVHHDPSNLPKIPPEYTAAPCESRNTFDNLKLHRIFGCRKFRNQQLLVDAADNAKLVHTGELPATLGSFATIPNPPRGKPIRKRRKYLDKVHMDIVFGDCVGLGGFRYAIILVDVATRYCWIYGLTTVSSADIISALEQFRADAEGMPKRFHADFDKKLIGGKALKWILSNKSNVIAAPARRQSSNGLAERTWQTIVTMARAYITEKQVGREYWFFSIRRAAQMLNQVPGRLNRRLTTPFELVHGVKPDPRTWFELFSVGYFGHESTDTGDKRSKTTDQPLDGIAVSRCDRSNTITFYNPITKSYYRPPNFKLDETRLPITSFPKSITFDGGLTCGLLRYNTDPVPEPFPPGTRVTLSINDKPTRGTIQNIPLPLPTSVSTAADATPLPPQDVTRPLYTILFDNGTSTECTYEQLVTEGQPTVQPSSPPTSTPTDAYIEGMPSFLQHNSKVTMDYNGQFQKGYIHYSAEGGFHFVMRRSSRSKTVDWSVPLPNFRQQWTTLVSENIIIPDHKQVSSFLKSVSTNSAPSLNFVSAKNLFGECPPSLVKALHPNNPDRQVWLDSYDEEKQGLLDHDVYEKINKKQYLALVRSGKIPKAIPSMCVMVVKTDRDGKPHRAKSRIVVLGNHEDRYFERSKKYAPVLKYSSLRLLTSKCVGDKRVLQQGDCKNAFCNALLPDDGMTVIRPPVGDPAHKTDEFWLLRRTLYGLRRSPHHWYNMVTGILKDMGLQASPHDPCLFHGIIDEPNQQSTKNTSKSSNIKPLPNSPPSKSTTSSSASPASLPTSLPKAPREEIYIGLYVDDFVFYSKSDAEEQLFQKVLKSKLEVDFMGVVDYFLGTAFTWKHLPDDHVSVHMVQSAFTEHTGHRFGVDKMNLVPNMTPYRSGYPIDSIPAADPSDPDLKRRTKVYQGIVGSINWLATCTRPDVAPALTFLATYNLAPSHQHYKAAIHVLKYLVSTSEYGISYHSNACHTLQAFNHFPHHHDKEAYTDATPPSPSECQDLTAYSDACWGSQIGNTIPDGTPLDLYKFRSLSGFLICRSGGPIAWKSVRQEKTALSSCEAEIVATNECVTELLSVKHRAQDLGMADGSARTTVYNDNMACVQWTNSVTTKGIKHINLRETQVRECHQSKEAQVLHIAGVINPADIFTKEMKDSAHFRRLRDCMMVSKSAWSKYHSTVPSHIASAEKLLPYYSLHSTREASGYSSDKENVTPSSSSKGNLKPNFKKGLSARRVSVSVISLRRSKDLLPSLPLARGVMMTRGSLGDRLAIV